jgi:hypothetical protein
MPYGTGRLCSCNNDFCLKSPLCDYNSLTNPYDSSSGIDKNPYELKEGFKNIKNIKNIDNHSNSIIYFIIFIIIGIIILANRK